MLKKLSLSAGIAALMATGALAQNTAPTQPAPTDTPPAATAPVPDAGAVSSAPATKMESVSFKSALQPSEMLVSKLRNVALRNAAGESLGDINDIVVDSTGKATVAIIGVGGFLGLGEKNIGVPFDALVFADASDGTRVARLDVTKETLHAAPSYVFKDTTAATNVSKSVSQ